MNYETAVSFEVQFICEIQVPVHKYIYFFKRVSNLSNFNTERLRCDDCGRRLHMREKQWKLTLNLNLYRTEVKQVS